MADEGATWVIPIFEGDKTKELGYDDVDLHFGNHANSLITPLPIKEQ